MKKNSQIGRVLIALGVSAALNIVWLVADGLIDWQKEAPSKAARVVEAFGKVGGTFGGWFAPSGHTVGTFLVGSLLVVVSSILFYAAVVWILLSLFSLPAWWRA
jgi:hypothetical protein